MVSLNLTGLFFNRHLSLSLIPKYQIFKSTGIYDFTKGNFSIIAQATAYVKNFYFLLYYYSENNIYSQYIYQKSKTLSEYGLVVGYNTDNWNFRVQVTNPFKRTYANNRISLNTENYKYGQTLYDSMAKNGVVFEISYTFDYGKQMMRGNEVNYQDNVEGVILK